MSYIIELFILNLFVFLNNRFVQAYNETCGSNQPPCVDPLKCINGYCLCSNLAKTTDEKNPLSFWHDGQCIPCPVDYTTTGTKCYSLTLGKGNQLTWERARERCKEKGGDLLVFRSDEEYKSISAVVKASGKENEMFQRAPQDGKYFGSIWIGIKLSDWRGDGSFNFVSHGQTLTKKSPYWCSHSSPLGNEPNYVQLKSTGERQACIGLAFFKDGPVCMHDWFCSWESHTLCEFHPPAPVTTTTIAAVEALEEKSSNTMLYMGVGGVILLVLSGAICAFYFLCNKKKNRRRARSFDSGESGMSQNSVY